MLLLYADNALDAFNAKMDIILFTT